MSHPVIPTKVGIQKANNIVCVLDPRLREGDVSGTFTTASKLGEGPGMGARVPKVALSFLQ